MIFNILIYVYLFVLGASFSSFINVVNFRGSWRKALFGHSRCDSCNVKLGVRDLIPLVSFLIQSGKCRVCKNKIPKTYFISEILTGFLFISAFVVTDNLFYSVEIMVASLFLIPIVIEDIKTKTVPEILSIPFAYIALLLATVYGVVNESYAPLLFGLTLAFPFFLIWLVSKGRAMGLADSKIAISLGFLSHSLIDTISIFLFSFWVGTIITLSFIIYSYIQTGNSDLGMKSKIPFIPFLALAYFLVAVLGVNIYLLIGWVV